MPTVLFTNETAAEMGRRSAEARARAKLTVAQSLNLDQYQLKRLLRIRKQLDAIDTEIDQAIAEGESKRVKELCDAQTRLSEQEFALANRPKPGQYRPVQPTATRRRTEPLPPPEPVPPTTGSVPPAQP